MTGIQNVGYTAGMEGEKFFIPTNESNEQEKKKKNKYRLHNILAQEAGAEPDPDCELHRCEAIAARIAKSIVRLVDQDNGSISSKDEEARATVRELAKIQNELTKFFVFSTKDNFSDFENQIRRELKKKTSDTNLPFQYVTYMNQFLHGTGNDWREAPIEGAKSEAAYISTRADELGLWDPKTKEPTTTAPSSGVFSQLCSNVEIDAFKKVDVTEVHYTKDEHSSPEHITELRLVQVKTGPVDEQETERIHRVHQRFVAGMQEYTMPNFDHFQETTELNSKEEVLVPVVDEIFDCLEQGDTPDDALVLYAASGSLTSDPEERSIFVRTLKDKIEHSDKNLGTLPNGLATMLTELRNQRREKKEKNRKPVQVRIKKVVSTIIAEGKEISVQKLEVPHHEDREGGLEYLR